MTESEKSDRFNPLLVEFLGFFMNKRSFLYKSACSALALATIPTAAFANTVNYSIQPFPSAVSQGNADLCWLAASAVMFSHKNQRPFSMADAAAELGGVYVLMHVQARSLPVSDIPLWLTAGGFRSEAPQSLGASGWENLLKTRGPLITLVDGTNSGAINHAVVVVGISGDGTQNGTTISFANGQSGTIEAASLTDFTKIYAIPGGADELFSIAYFA